MQKPISDHLLPLSIILGLASQQSSYCALLGDLFPHIKKLEKDAGVFLLKKANFHTTKKPAFYTSLRAALLSLLENQAFKQLPPIDMHDDRPIKAKTLIKTVLNWLALIAPRNTDDIVTQEPINGSMMGVLPLGSGHLIAIESLLGYHVRRNLRADLDNTNRQSPLFGFIFRFLCPYTNKPIKTHDQELMERALASEDEKSPLKEKYRFGNERLFILFIWQYATDHPNELSRLSSDILDVLDKQIRPSTLRILCENGDIAIENDSFEIDLDPKALTVFDNLPNFKASILTLDTNTPEKNDALFKHALTLLIKTKKKVEQDHTLSQGLKRVLNALVRKYQPEKARDMAGVLALDDAAGPPPPARIPPPSRRRTCLKHSLQLLIILMVSLFIVLLEPVAQRFAGSGYNAYFLGTQQHQSGANGFYMLDEGFSSWRHRCIELASFSCFALLAWLGNTLNAVVGRGLDENQAPQLPRQP